MIWSIVLCLSVVTCLQYVDASIGSSLEGYHADAARNWPSVPKEYKFNHPVQSPVDLITSKAVTKALPELNIIEEHLQGTKATLYNSGHSVYVYTHEDDIAQKPYLVGGPLKSQFVFQQMHFHWGEEDIWGSEHFIDGESAAVEIHLVHWNSEYGSYENAATQPEGLAVLTIFAEAVGANNTLLDPLEELMPLITKAETAVTLDAWDALKWVASAMTSNTEYYTYPGSLTTPPYTENVYFIVLPSPIRLSPEQLQTFRSMDSEDSAHILANKRNLQPLHNRPVVRSTSLQ